MLDQSIPLKKANSVNKIPLFLAIDEEGEELAPASGICQNSFQ